MCVTHCPLGSCIDTANVAKRSTQQMMDILCDYWSSWMILRGAAPSQIAGGARFRRKRLFSLPGVVHNSRASWWAFVEAPKSALRGSCTHQNHCERGRVGKRGVSAKPSVECRSRHAGPPTGRLHSESALTESRSVSFVSNTSSISFVADSGRTETSLAWRRSLKISW